MRPPHGEMMVFVSGEGCWWPAERGKNGGMKPPTTLAPGPCAAPLMCALLMCALPMGTAGCFRSAPASDAGALDAAACSSLSPSTVIVQAESAGTDSPPPASGGALMAGAYHLMSSVYYPSSGCSTTGLATSLRVTLASTSTGTIDTLTTTAGGSVSESISFTSSGTSLTLRLDCISPDPTGLGSTAAIIPYSAGDDGTIRLTTASPTCGTSIDTYVAD